MGYLHQHYEEAQVRLGPRQRRSREQRVADRLAPQVMAAASAGETEYDVTNRLGFTRTYEAGVYALIAVQLDEEDVKFEAHRFSDETFLSTDGFTVVPSEEEHDRIVVTSLPGRVVQRGLPPDFELNHVARVFPPEPEDPSSMHNLSIMGQ